MPNHDPDDLTIGVAYAERTLLFSWRPDQPGVRVIIAGERDPDVVVTLDQDRDTDDLVRLVRRLVLRLPATDG